MAKEKKVKRNFTVDTSVSELVDKAAEDDDRNSSSMVNKILRDWLVKHGYYEEDTK